MEEGEDVNPHDPFFEALRGNGNRDTSFMYSLVGHLEDMVGDTNLTEEALLTEYLDNDKEMMLFDDDGDSSFQCTANLGEEGGGDGSVDDNNNAVSIGMEVEGGGGGTNGDNDRKRGRTLSINDDDSSFRGPATLREEGAGDGSVYENNNAIGIAM